MELYRAIADRYDDIFPLDPAQADFISSRLAPGSAILDSGCASGSLAYELASRGHRVVGIDSSPRLIAAAVRKARALEDPSKAPEFRLLDIQAAPKAFPPASFGAALCLGNTLPHLPGAAAIGAGLSGFRGLLAPGGLLVLQLIDFAAVSELGMRGLPPIDNRALRFERDYPGFEPGKFFEFRTRLYIKPAAEPVTGSTVLYAVTRDELDGLLEGAGFAERRYLAGFGEDPAPSGGMAASGPPSIVVLAS